MNVLIIALVTLITAGLAGVLTRVSFRQGHAAGRREHLGRVGFTAGCVDRYQRAVAIMERLDGSLDCHGVLAGDTLSAGTQEMVTEWVAAHRKEFPPR